MINFNNANITQNYSLRCKLKDNFDEEGEQDAIYSLYEYDEKSEKVISRENRKIKKVNRKFVYLIFVKKLRKYK